METHLELYSKCAVLKLRIEKKLKEEKGEKGGYADQEALGAPSAELCTLVHYLLC